MSRPVGELVRHWRENRHLSQLDLSIQTEISSRHLSFVETGRSQPSRDMLLRLSDQLELPLRERNSLLLAGGFAPVFPETPLDSPRMASIRGAIRQVLAGHEPYPAVVVDRHWTLVEANSGLQLFTAVIAPHLLEPPANVLRASLHPEGLAPLIVNHGEWRGHLLHRLRRQAVLTSDQVLLDLAAELAAYPCDGSEPEPGSARASRQEFGQFEHPAAEVVIPLRVRHPAGELAFFSTISTFGHPSDVTVAELAIESFFPADEHTRATLNS